MTIEINIFWLYCYLWIAVCLWVVMRFLSCLAPNPKPFFSKDPDQLNEMLGFTILAIFWPVSLLFFIFYTVKIFKREFSKKG